MNPLHIKLTSCLVAACCSLSLGAAELRFNTQDFPPFSYAVVGAVAGPGVEVIRHVCKDVKLDCSFALLPWARAQHEVEEGTAHALFLIGWNEERAKTLYFSHPILETHYGFFVGVDNPLQYRQPADVAGYTVGVYGPSNTSKSLERIRDRMSKDGVQALRIDMRPDDESGFRKLGLARVQAVYSNHDVGRSMVARLDIKNIRYAGHDESLKYYVGFSRKHVSQAVVDQFNAGFRKAHQDGTIGRILAAHQMKEVPQKSWEGR